MFESLEQVRVTVLYPIPVNLNREEQFKGLAALYDGEFIGSGTDGAERDLVFDFPMMAFGVSNGLPCFLEAVLKAECQVLLSAVAEAVEVEALDAVEVG